MELYLFGILAFFVVVVTVRLIMLEILIKKYANPKKSGGPDGLLLQHSSRLDDICAAMELISKDVHAIKEDTPCMIQKIGIVRFNPFSSSGGDQSFAIALLDSNNNGILLSSLYLQNQTRVYAKPIEKGESSYALSAEEKRALDKAAQSIIS